MKSISFGEDCIRIAHQGPGLQSNLADGLIGCVPDPNALKVRETKAEEEIGTIKIVLIYSVQWKHLKNHRIIKVGRDLQDLHPPNPSKWEITTVVNSKAGSVFL